MAERGQRGRRILERARRGAFGEDRTASEPGNPVPGRGEGWDHTVDPQAPVTRSGDGAAGQRDELPLRARILALLSDPRVDALTPAGTARALGVPRQDVQVEFDAMVSAGDLVAEHDGARYLVSPAQKHRLEQMFKAAAVDLGEQGVLMRTAPEHALSMLEDDADEPRLPVTAGLLSLFLPGTGQLLNGDVGRASLVFAVWSLAWITHLSPVWTFVCLYAGAEAFFTAKIRAMERKLARDAAQALPPGAGSPRALPPKPT